jgi:hypothetical protein
MKGITLIQDYVKNPEKIVELCDTVYAHLFERREGELAHGSSFSFNSRFSTLYSRSMDDSFIDLIFKDSKFDPDLRDFFSFIQIQRYQIGDYIIPHQDKYHVQRLHLVTLCDSLIDGVTIEDDDHVLYRVNDVAGQKIESPMYSWHWVNPIADKTRYSLVIGE